MRVRYIIVVILGIFCLGTNASAQSDQFGKNKVQYRTFDWKYIQSPHFDIYFYEGGREIAEFCAEAAEPALESIQRTCRYDITARITIILYNSHNDFQQTNATGEYLPEGVGGFTELFKNRVVLPFEGDYTKFRHVIHHELVHAVLNDMFTGGSLQTLITGGGMQIPTWMNEGLAEYEAHQGMDIETDQFMRDATLADEVPTLARLGGYTQYRVGQTMYAYIAEKYGPEKVGELLNRIRTTRSAELGFRSTFGLSISDFGDRFIEHLKKQFYPDISRFEDPASYAEIIADHKKLNNFFNASPVISPNGDYVAYISDRSQTYDVYVQSIANPRDVRRVLSGGGSTADFEELHLLAPGLCWTADGKKLVLVSKAGRYDAISLIDVGSGKIEQLPMKEFDGIFQVSASPDGKYLGFIAYKDGASDVYIYNLADESITNLTRDVYSDKDICWMPDSKGLIFSSDRRDHVIPGEYPVDGIAQAAYKRMGWDLYRIDIAGTTIERLTTTDGIDEERPSIANDKKILFYISNTNGINNIYTADLDCKNSRPVTNSVSRIVQISSSSDASKIAFGAVNKTGYNLYLLRNPLDRHFDSLPRTPFVESRTERTSMIDSLVSKYSLRDTINSTRDSIAGYGSVDVDLSNYVFSDNRFTDRNRYNPSLQKKRPAAVITNFKDSSGRYVVRDYKVVFSSDLIMGTAGYFGYYGLVGSAQMLFSDELGNHQLYFATNLVFDLKNSDYLLAYYNLTNRLNYGFIGYHTARLLYTTPDKGYENTYSYFLSRFTALGVTGMASYPFDRFRRIDMGVSAMLLDKDVIDDVLDIPTKHKFAVSPSASYVFDNTIWNYFYPNQGTRYNIGLAAAPSFGKNMVGFVTPSVDMRHYIPLFGGFSLATRFAGAASFGPNPQRFYLGGTEGWINRAFSDITYPVTEPEDVSFYGIGMPLRGFALNERVGTKYFLANLGLRFPFPILVSGAPLGLYSEIFSDAGTAWNKNVYLFQKQPDGSIITRDLLLSTGIGLRTYFYGFFLKLDIAWRLNLQSFSKPEYLFSLGQDF